MQVLFLLITVCVIAFACCGMAWVTLQFMGIYREMQQKLNIKQPVKRVIVEKEIDHEPFIKTCIEVVRMKKRIERLDAKEKKHLLKSLERLEEFCRDKGYEIISYEGAVYHEGMNLKASFVPSEEIERGCYVITRVIKPQINFQNALVHLAEVEVSVGE